MIIKDYPIDHLVGVGGMAVVYCAFDRPARRWVALKVLKPEFQDVFDARERFRREAEIHGSLKHPHIVRVYDFTEDGDGPLLVMEYIKGSDLARKIDAQRKIGKPFDLPQSVSFLTPISEALGYAHQERGIVHCDVKPRNILLDERGRILLTDFGISKEEDTRQEEVGPFGAPAYMAPEQCNGKAWGRIGTYTDVYAMGIVLYELLTLERPFYGKHAEQGETTKERIRWEQEFLHPVSPRKLNPAIPVFVEQAILTALEKEPRQRQPTPNDFLRDITHGRVKSSKDTRRNEPRHGISEPIELIRWGKPPHVPSEPAPQPKAPPAPKMSRRVHIHLRNPFAGLMEWRNRRKIRQVSARSGFVAYVDVIRGEGVGERYWIEKRGLTVGRDNRCDIPFSDETVSRRHADFVVDRRGAVHIRNWSRNGTMVNGFFRSSQRLNESDRITIGDTTLQLHYCRRRGWRRR
jgi:serine/threonine protein kinase